MCPPLPKETSPGEVWAPQAEFGVKLKTRALREE